MFAVTAAFTALEALGAALAVHRAADLPIGSVSGCHGALALLRVEAR
jgi:hypothetical protein